MSRSARCASRPDLDGTGTLTFNGETFPGMNLDLGIGSLYRERTV